MKKYIEKIKKQSNLSTQILIVVGIILVINFLSYQIFYRFDLTQDNIYSISETTKQTLRELDDIVTIKAYFSEDLPIQFQTVHQEVADILDEYQNYSNNNIAVEFIDPKADEELQQQLQIQGIPQLQFNNFKNDKYEVVNGYIGMSVSFGDNTQAIPVIEDTRSLEYQLTSLIKKITSEKTPTLGIAAGNGETPADQFSATRDRLAEIYEIRTVDISTEESISDDIDTMLFVGSKAEFSDRERYVIDQFLMKGKSAVFLIDGVSIDDNLIATANDLSINNLISKYGISVNNYFVLDKLNDFASFNQGFVSITTPYPFFVKIIEDGLNKDSAIVSKIQQLIMPWTSPLTVNYEVSDDLTVLAQTTADAWLMRDNFNLSPQTDFGFNADPDRYALIASRFGPIQSAFDSKVEKTAADDTVAVSDSDTAYLSSTDNARVIVAGNSKFMTNTFINRYPDNLIFMQNIVDAVSLDESLISIRSKNINDRPLDEISDSQKKFVRYFNIFGITILVLAIGLIRYSTRKKSKFADEL